MGIFGGVQVLTILCSIIRTKFIAILIGPAGIGLFGLYNSAIEMITSFSSLGIRSSSVRDLAAAETTMHKRIVAKVIRRWSLIVGILGAVTTLALSPLLSKFTFGDDNHILGFIAISITLFFSALTKGEEAILQGNGMLSRLAKASVAGSIGGVIVSVPLFYFFGIDSIVPSLIAFSVITAISMFTYRDRQEKVKLPWNETISLGKGFVKLGIFMTLSDFITMLCSYAFSAYLNNKAGTDVVGYYQAGYTLVNKYAGLLFTAMAMEYYPRIAQSIKSNKRTQVYVAQQINITLLFLLPVITMFLLFKNIIVEILYSSEFNIIVPLISYAVIGTIFKAVSWSMAFVILAKGNGKVYIITESISSAIGLILNIIGYNMWGLAGIGISYVLWYFIYTIIMAVCYYGYYKLKLNSIVWKLTISVFTISTFLLIASFLENVWISIPIGVIAIGFSIFFLSRILRIRR